MKLINKSLMLGRFAGIPVRIHWSFFLLILFIIYAGSENSLGVEGTLWLGAVVLTLFFCVLLHEFGHALAAKKFGVKTRDIILSPIGGMARLERLPTKPLQEFYVAIAGPAVNMVIALLLALGIWLFASSSFQIHVNSLEYLFNKDEYIKLIFWMNLVLCGFNLIPAFPMDGGRILRSLLSIQLGKMRSTKIASLIGKVIAILFLILGFIIPQLFLALIGLFVFFMASQEARSVRIEELLASFTVDTIYNKEIIRVNPENEMELLIDHVFRSTAKNFLVFDNDTIIGCVPEMFVMDAMKNQKRHEIVRNVMSANFDYINPDSTVLEAYQLMNEKGISILAVRKESEILGYIDRNIIQNLVDTNPKS